MSKSDKYAQQPLACNRFCIAELLNAYQSDIISVYIRSNAYGY